MRQFVQLLEQEVDGHDGKLVAVRQMNPLKRRMPLGKRKYSLIGKVVHPDEADATKLGERRQLEDRHIRQQDAV